VKSSPKMRQVIEQLAAKHEVNLNEVGASLRLDMSGYDSLYIQGMGPTLIRVAHRFESQGVLIPDPEVLFFTGYGVKWIALAITQAVGGNRTYAHLSNDGTRLVRYHKTAQASLADFVNMWAQNIKDQGWLEHGVKHLDLGAQLAAKPLFALGQVVATPGALEAIEEAQQTPQEFLTRHVQGDWETLDAHDQRANQQAVKEGDRILSVYETNLGTRLYVITEWDRSVTTLLLPADY
jgi:hypothetical protein